MGLLEFLKWCEDMKAEPLLAVYAGYSLKGMHVNPGPDLEPFVQDALDEIEYITGDTNTRWGAERAKDGHPAPFTLHYVEIGNEDWFDKSGSYDARFTQFFDAIKAKYPRLKLISTIGNDQPENKRVHSLKPDMTDEHYYRSVDTFLQMSPAYAQKYDRSGPEIFVGEWAAYETSFPPWDRQSKNEPPTPNMKAAIGDGVFLAAMERNSDLIKMQCYAPLLVNVNPGARQWRPDLIGYDGLHVYGSPSYYAIRMFSQNHGDTILQTSVGNPPLHYSATKDSQSGAIYLKIVNTEATPKALTITLHNAGVLASDATALTLSAPSDSDSNSIDNPAQVIPVTSTVPNIKPAFTYTFVPYSVTVLRLKQDSH